MKQIIVLVAMIILGGFIAGLVASDEEGSIKSALSNVWTNEVERQNTYP